MSRMVKLGLRPTSSAWRRRILAPIEWNVPIQGKPSGIAGQRLDALAHFARRLVGEGDGEDLVPAGADRGEQMGDAGGQHARLADAGAGEHQHRPVERLDGLRCSGFSPRDRRGRRAGALGVERTRIGRGAVSADMGFLMRPSAAGNRLLTTASA